MTLIRFTELNLTGIRKILKKHNRIYPSHKSTEEYLSDRSWEDSRLKQLLHYEGAGALVTALQEAFADLNAMEETLYKNAQNNSSGPPLRNQTAPDLAVTSSLEDGWKQALQQTELAQKPRKPTSSNLLIISINKMTVPKGSHLNLHCFKSMLQEVDCTKRPAL